MNKILTILVPVYNTEKYIKRCLDSVLLNEVLNDIEVLAVNDGGKDNSLKILKEYQKKFPNTIIIIDKENGGHGSTINKGIEHAKGKYFRVLDSDDWFHCLDFIKFVKRLKKEKADLIVTNYRKEYIYNSKSELITYKNLKDNITYNFDEIDLSILSGEYFVMATSTYKTDILRKSGLKLLEKTFYVDMQYNIIPIKLIKNFTFYNLDIYRYFIGRSDQSMNLNSFVRNQDHHERVINFLLEYYLNNKNLLSKNKKHYIFLILKYMLNTHYTIYCIYDSNHKTAYQKIKKFDKHLYNLDTQLYREINSIKYIKCHRKTKFIFVLINGKLFNKALNILKIIFK